MEITFKISGEEYKSFIRKYYLEKKWTKRIATVAIISLALSVFEMFQTTKEWIVIVGFFVIIFIILMLLFFVIPYCEAYIKSTREIKRTGDEPIIWNYRIEDKGITIIQGQIEKFLPWRKLDRLLILQEFIVFRTISSQAFPLPSRALSDDDHNHLLVLVKNYQKKPGNKKPNPIPIYFIGLLSLIPFLGGIAGLVLIILGMTTYKNIIMIIIGTSGLLISGYVLNDMIQTQKQSSAYEEIDKEGIAATAPEDYQHLLANDVVFNETRTSRLRKPITKFNYKQFHGIIYKIDSLYNVSTPLTQIIKQTSDDTHITYHRSYRIITDFGNSLEVSLIMRKPAIPKVIYFNLYGNNTQVIAKNDSIEYFYSNFKNFFIQYKQIDEQEFFGKASHSDDDSARMPLEIMFFKRNSNLYFILLAANKSNTKLPSELLYNLVIKKN